MTSWRDDERRVVPEPEWDQRLDIASYLLAAALVVVATVHVFVPFIALLRADGVLPW